MVKRMPALILAAAIFLAVFAIGRTAFADDRYYTIDNYTINADILPDGSADIEERITYRFSGSFNGIFRNVDYMLTDGMENIRLFVEEGGVSREFTVNSANDLDYNGSPGTYNMIRDDEMAKFKIFEKSNNEVKTFVFKYTFRNVVIKYNDIAEFNRKLVDSNWDVSLNNILINIRLPEGARQDEIRVFGHGPLTGESRIKDDRNVVFELAYSTPGYWVETRVLFPAGLVPQSSNIKDEEALPRVMEEEKKLADEANREREMARAQVAEYERRRLEEEKRRAAEQARKDAMRPLGNALVGALFLSWFAVIIYIYIKYDKEYEHSFEGKYYRELPGEYTPAEMTVLLTMGRVETRDITATLMDLVRKQQLLLTTETYVKIGFFSSKEVQDYAVSINPEAPYVSMKKHEAFLINWFVGIIGDGRRVLLDEIADYARTSSGARRFAEDYNTWRNMAKDEAEKNKFFEASCKKGQLIGILSAVGYIVAGIMLTSVFETGFGVAVIIQSIILFIFSARLNKRTVYGNEQNAMWKAFKNFLKDFSQMDKAIIPSIVIWEHYLVYAISLGVAKEVIRQLPLVFADTDLQNTHLTYMYGHRLSTFSSFANTFDRTVSTVDSAISRAMTIANSKNSSSSGRGGGFSGGGFGGGTGGGGGRGGGGAF